MTFVKQNKVLALVLAILMTVALFTVGAGIAVSAQDDASTYKLTVDFDASTASVYLSVDGIEREMMSQNAYDITRGAEVKIRIVAKDGYTIKGAGGLFETVDGREEQVLINKDTGESTYGIDPFNRDRAFTLRCVTRTFDIDFCPSVFAPAGDSTLDYNFESGAPDLAVVFNGDAVTIPAPTKEGYIFQNWTMVNSRGEDLGLKAVEGSFQLNNEQLLVKDILDTGMIYLRANFEPIRYLVTRYDYVYDGTADGFRGDKLGEFQEYENMGVVINSHEWGGVADYIGYKLREGSAYTWKVNVTDELHKNDIRRFYDPIVYTLRFDFGGGVEVDSPTTHTYNASTALPTSTRLGYTFIGWIVIVDGVEVATVTADGDGAFYLAGKTEAYAATVPDEETGMPVIHLRASWEPDRYQILYDTTEGATADGTPIEHVYGTPTEIPTPIRKGYTFLGWYINGSDVLTPAPADGNFILAADQLPLAGGQAISLKAAWEVKTFTVLLGGNAGTDIVQTLDPSFTVTYNTPVPNLSQIPQRLGYTFCGFTTEKNGGTLYIDADGNGVGNWLEDGVTTLYAQWEAKPYRIELTTNSANHNDCIDYIEINGVRYEIGDEYVIRYRETVTVRIVTKAGYKLVSWRGGAQTHSSDFEAEYRHLEPNDKRDIHFIVFPVVESPSFVIDYENETLLTEEGSIPAGVYYIYDESGALWHSLEVDAGGMLRLDGDMVEAVAIPEEFFGTTISIVRRAPKDSLRADGDAVPLTVSARPSAPAIIITPDVYDREIYVNVHAVAGEMHEYQYAISIDAGGKGLIWQDSNRFEHLEPGTTYFVYVRVKHTQNEPHSLPTEAKQVNTSYEAYLIEVSQRLDALKHSGDGENVDRIIQNAKDEIEDLRQYAPNNAFYANVEAVIQNAEESIPLARQMDLAIGKLTDKVESMEESGSYDHNGKNTLRAILRDAIALISVSENNEEIQAHYKQADKDLDQVPVTSITVSDSASNTTVEVIVSGGLDPQNKPTLLRYPTLDYLTDKVDAAIQAGNVIVYQNGLTVASAIEELRTQDVMAAFRLTLADASLAGDYEVRLLIPSDLRDVMALRVAYYNDETQTLEVLVSHVEGDYVVFYSNHLSDFILFGDPTVSLTTAIILLGATLAIQLIAIALILTLRKKTLANASAKCVSVPVAALTIRFLPANGLIVVILLAAAVIVCTVVLVWLLLTTGIRRAGEVDEDTTDGATEEAEAAPLYAIVDDRSADATLDEPEAVDEPEQAFEVFDDNGADREAFAAFDEESPVVKVDDEEAFASAFFVDASDFGADEDAPESEEVVYEYYEDGDEAVQYDDAEVDAPEFAYALPEEPVETEYYADADDEAVEYIEEVVEYVDDNGEYTEEEVVYVDENGEYVDGDVEYVEEVVEYAEEEVVYVDENGEYVDGDVEYVEEVVEYAEEELGDIDDSYLADEETVEELDEIDDSKE